MSLYYHTWENTGDFRWGRWWVRYLKGVFTYTLNKHTYTSYIVVLCRRSLVLLVRKVKKGFMCSSFFLFVKYIRNPRYSLLRTIFEILLCSKIQENTKNVTWFAYFNMADIMVMSPLKLQFFFSFFLIRPTKFTFRYNIVSYFSLSLSFSLSFNFVSSSSFLRRFLFTFDTFLRDIFFVTNKKMTSIDLHNCDLH